MTDQELLQEMSQMMEQKIKENNKDLLHSMQIIIENVVDPKFNLLADEISIVREKLDNLERKVDGLEDKVLEHDFRLKIIK